MRRPHALPLAAVVALALAACGSDDGTGSSPADSQPSDTVITDGTLVPVTGPADDTIPTDSTVPVPSVVVPDEIPTELVITDLEVGTGPEAAAGDTVIVDYVGVRTATGESFDNSYDAEPFSVLLGQGGVIQGWEQGLLGIQAGGVRQLDIPADLAYGDNPPAGSIIEPGDALSFLVEARAVVPPPDPADAPRDLEVEPSTGASEVTTTDVVEGDGATLEIGQTGLVNMLIMRGDTTEILFDTWEQGQPFQIDMEEGVSLPGLLEGLVGMKVGGQRIIVIPPDDAFGPDGDEQLGLPANTDLIVVAELFGAY